MTTKQKKWYVVCYMRIEPENPELMTLMEALMEAEQAETLQPENKYTIECVEDGDN